MASLVTDAIKALIGRASEPWTVEVEKGLLKKLAAAIGDENPMWQDGREAPPSLIFSLMMSFGDPDRRPNIPTGAMRRLDAGADFDFFETIAAGDTITNTVKFAEAYERQGKSGPMLFLVFETSHVNQAGKLAAQTKSYTVCY